MSWTLAQLAKQVNAELKGNGDGEIHSVATLDNAGPGQISFFTNKKYRDQLRQTRAEAVILRPEFSADCPTNCLVSDNPHAAYARIATILHPIPENVPGIHPSAQIADSVNIAKSACIGANVVIGEDTTIADNVFIGPNTSIGRHSVIGQETRILANVCIGDKVIVGKRGLIHPGVVIGADGFGQAYEDGKWIKVPQIGAVRLGDDVEIGANTTVDRGTIEDTVIEDGVKLDNQIQIAHNVRVGAHTIIAAATAVAGSTDIGRHCMIAGAVAIAGHLQIADGVTITGMTMISKSIPKPGSFSSGISAEETANWHRLHSRIKQLDDLAIRLRQMEKKLKNT